MKAFLPASICFILCITALASCQGSDLSPEEQALFVSFEDLEKSGMKVSKHDMVTRNMISYNAPEGGKVYRADYTLNGPQGGAWLLTTSAHVYDESADSRESYNHLIHAFQTLPENKQGFEVKSAPDEFQYGDESEILELWLGDRVVGSFFICRKDRFIFQMATDGFEIPDGKWEKILPAKLEYLISFANQ